MCELDMEKLIEMIGKIEREDLILLHKSCERQYKRYLDTYSYISAFAVDILLHIKDDKLELAIPKNEFLENFLRSSYN